MAMIVQLPLPLGMNPGTPVSTTELYLTRNVIPLEIRMRFNVNNGRFDPRRLKDRLRLVQADIGQSNGLAQTLIHQALQRLPRFEQRHS
jgi:hypothetical protein